MKKAEENINIHLAKLHFCFNIIIIIINYYYLTRGEIDSPAQVCLHQCT